MKALFRAAALAAIAAAPSTPADAQTCTGPAPQTTPPAYSCLVGSPVQATFDWLDGSPTTGDVLRLYVDNVQVGPDLPALPASGIQIAFGGTLPAGSYSVQVAAFRPITTVGPFEAKSSPVTLLLTAPSAPPPPPPPAPPPPDPPPPPPPPDPPVPAAPGGLRIVDVTMLGLDRTGRVLWTYTLSLSVGD